MTISISTRCVKRWREDPAAFLREVCDVEPQAWQLALLTALNRGEAVELLVDVEGYRRGGATLRGARARGFTVDEAMGWGRGGRP